MKRSEISSAPVEIDTIPGMLRKFKCRVPVYDELFKRRIMVEKPVPDPDKIGLALGCQRHARTDAGVHEKELIRFMNQRQALQEIQMGLRHSGACFGMNRFKRCAILGNDPVGAQRLVAAKAGVQPEKAGARVRVVHGHVA